MYGLTRLTIFSFIDIASTITSSSGKTSGAVVSTTETNCVSFETFPEASAADQVTIVSPIAKNCDASFIIETISPLSETVASPKLISFWLRLVASITISSGARKIGIIVSVIVTFCTKFDTFPAKSVAVHVTTVSPIGKNSGASLVITTSPKVSAALGACNSTMLSSGTTASATIFGIGTMTGEVVSRT